MVDDFILISGGKEIRSKENFRQWLRDFLGLVNDLKFESVESFQNEDGSRVASRWRVSGRNNGILGGESDQREITFTGTAVWAVREDGNCCATGSSVRRLNPLAGSRGLFADSDHRPPARRPPLGPYDAPGMRLALLGVIIYSCRNGQVPI